jgi:hypothetical protein
MSIPRGLLVQRTGKKRDTGMMGKRSHTFPIYLSLSAERLPHRKHHERMKRNLQKFEDAWEILSEPIAKQRDPKAWPLLK